jgi:D-sedoheptulose 7-phosphate isomerase
MQERIKSQIKNSAEVQQRLLESADVLAAIEQAAAAVISAFRNKKKLMLAGNGGSAADAQHIAAEFVNRFGFDRPGLPAIALTTDTSIITAVGNDSRFERVFARQAEALGIAGDVFLGISTSGTSHNIIEALETCRKNEILTIGLTGIYGGIMKDHCDICIKVPSGETPRIQEMHSLVGHIICSLVEEELFSRLNKKE